MRSGKSGPQGDDHLATGPSHLSGGHVVLNICKQLPQWFPFHRRKLSLRKVK